MSLIMSLMFFLSMKSCLDWFSKGFIFVFKPNVLTGPYNKVFWNISKLQLCRGQKNQNCRALVKLFGSYKLLVAT